MKPNFLFSLLIIVALVILACEKDSSNPVEPTTLATEVWGFIMNDDSTSYGETTFEKKSNGSITGAADWHFMFANAAVECPFESGTVIVADTVISVSATGTATNSAAPIGFQSSPFVVSVTGVAHNGLSYGSWSITFSTFGWPALVQGTFAAARTSGSGITN
jgi:hypothetical protein